MRRCRLGGLTVPVLGLALAGCAERANGGLSESVLAGPEPDPVSRMVFSGGNDSRITRGRPDRTQPNMRAAPELFAATGVALWDGSPTLGGLWIAHHEAAIAHQVRVRNPRTGTVIDAALMPRRGGSDGGIGISAAAADALGLVPSVPAELDVVAIERQAGADPAAWEGTPDPAAVQAPAPDTPMTDGNT